MEEDSENPFLSMVNENQSRKRKTGVLHCQQWINLGLILALLVLTCTLVYNKVKAERDFDDSGELNHFLISNAMQRYYFCAHIHS